jgi:hypothetical protein
MLGREQKWQELISLCLLRFHVYRLLLPDPSLTLDESALLDDVDVALGPSAEIDPFLF